MTRIAAYVRSVASVEHGFVRVAVMLLALAACSTTERPVSHAPPVSGAVASASSAVASGALASASSAPAPPEPRIDVPCADDMVDVTVACIDRYEAPNEAGAKPLRMQSADDASSWCRARGKRLCTEDEWLRACQGPNGAPYPYGRRYDEHACNHNKPYRTPSWKLLASWPSEKARAEAERLDQSEPSGARPTCASAEGVLDLTGNVAEWVEKTHAHPEACLTAEMTKHTHVLQGCSWAKCYREPHEPACGYVNCAHPGGFRSYEAGFRCCKDRNRPED